MASLLLIWCLIVLSAATAQATKPNIVFFMGESVASSAYFWGEKAPMPIPNLQWLMKNGISLPHTYAAAPVCNPSRSTTMSGRHAHRLGHYQQGPQTGLWVNGTWNNHEGLSSAYNNTFFNITQKYANYDWKIFGKSDFRAGLHSLSCRVTSWANKAQFPFMVDDESFGWYDEDGPTFSDKHTNNSNATLHKNDWNAVSEAAAYITKQAQSSQPWITYYGAWIVHPPYSTTSYYLDLVDYSMVDSPPWFANISEMHPEDYQSSMKKKMFGSCCTDEYKRQIRAHYYANIAEYDRLLGVVIDAVRDSGQMNNTWFIATSDHGDMKMEHQQYYKMVFYDSSSRVPSIIVAPPSERDVVRNVIRNDVVSSMLDYYPTILDIAGIDAADIEEDLQLDGNSLMAIIRGQDDDNNEDESAAAAEHPNYAMSQFHGDEIHLSWFLLRENEYKYVSYGSGQEVTPRLFNIAADPLEMDDLALNASYAPMLASMDAKLKTIIDYPAVAANVESYNKQSYALWRNAFPSEADYNETVSQDIRWAHSWAYDSDGSFQAIEQWLKTPNHTFFWAFP